MVEVVPCTGLKGGIADTDVEEESYASVTRSRDTKQNAFVAGIFLPRLKLSFVSLFQ